MYVHTCQNYPFMPSHLSCQEETFMAARHCSPELKQDAKVKVTAKQIGAAQEAHSPITNGLTSTKEDQAMLMPRERMNRDRREK